jgi:N-acetylglucosaminyl-diphospho-decaprenol L-rhamnosyltransferase
MPGSISRALSLLSRYPRAGAIGLMLVDHKLQPELQAFGHDVTPWQLLRRKFTTAAAPVAASPVGWVSGGALLVKREAFLALGGFDPAYFLYWEDVDFCRRLRVRNCQVILDPTARVIHRHGASLSDQSLKTRHYDTSADRYFRKYYPKLGWPLYRLSRPLYRLFLSSVA